MEQWEPCRAVICLVGMGVTVQRNIAIHSSGNIDIIACMLHAQSTPAFLLELIGYTSKFNELAL